MAKGATTPKVTTETPEPQVAEVSEQITESITNPTLERFESEEPYRPTETPEPQVAEVSEQTTPEFLDRIDNPENHPFIRNDDGSISTHRMADAEVDGQYIAYPEIQMIDGELTRLEGRAALDKALETNNFIEFPTAEEASEYARGGYKTEKFNTVSRSNRGEGEDMTSTFSGGNISEERLEELTLPSDTTTSLLIKRFENFNPVANWDVRQNTNGFGTEALNANEEVTMEVAQERLMAVITRDTNSIKNFDEEHGYNFTENETVGLVSFMFNLGPGSLNQVTANGTRSKEEIANKMLEYINSAGQPLQGLINRRQDEYDIFTGKVTI